MLLLLVQHQVEGPAPAEELNLSLFSYKSSSYGLSGDAYLYCICLILVNVVPMIHKGKVCSSLDSCRNFMHLQKKIAQVARRAKVEIRLSSLANVRCIKTSLENRHIKLHGRLAGIQLGTRDIFNA